MLDQLSDAAAHSIMTLALTQSFPSGSDRSRSAGRVALDRSTSPLLYG
ncbi:hypothetical protein [Plantactinospora mayteni]|nr:hypothetical protein [Plantactinospora mayteni]